MSNRSLSRALLLSCAVLPALAGVAAGQEPAYPATDAAAAAARMGDPGTISIQGDFQVALSRLSTSVPGDGEDPDAATTLSIAPAADYFVAPGISVGGTIGILYA